MSGAYSRTPSMRRTSAGGTSASHGTLSTASLTMIPVVCSLAPAAAFFSSTITRRPALAAARAQASPAKLAPMTSRSTWVQAVPGSLTKAGAGQGAADEDGAWGEKRQEEEACMGS
ncbi:hypothetical protein D9M68_554380 [compost metagenome]